MLSTPNNRLAIAVAGLALATTLWCLPGIGVRSTNGAHVAVDEPQYLLSATSLWEDLDLDISDELADERWRDYHEARLPEQTRPLDGDRRVSPHDPLLPVLLAAPTGVGGWVGAKVAMAAMAGALAAAITWVAVRRLRIPLVTAVLAVACFSLSLPLTAYATQVYPELPAALVVTLAVAAILQPSRCTSPSRCDQPAERRSAAPRRDAAAAGAGLAVVALPWLSVKYAPVAAVLAGLALLRMPEHRRWLLAWFAVNAVAYAGVHQAIYGGWTVYAAGDHFVGGELTVAGNDPDYAGRSRRLVALLVDRRYGLVAWQPAWLLLVPALGAAVRRRDPLTLVLGAGWLTATFVALTMHGFWWPGRQIVVVLPVAVLLIARWAPRWLLASGLAIGAAIWWWFVAGDSTWVVHWQPAAWLRRPLVPANHDAGLAAWSAIVVGGVLLAGRHQDPPAGEGAHADDAVADPDRDRPIG